MSVNLFSRSTYWFLFLRTRAQTQYMHLIQYYTVLIYCKRLFYPSVHQPEKPPSPLSRSGSGTLTSHSGTALDPSDPSYRNYFTKIQAELSPQKSPAVSYNMPDEKCIGNEACRWILNRHLDCIKCMENNPQPSNKMLSFLSLPNYQTSSHPCPTSLPFFPLLPPSLPFNHPPHHLPSPVSHPQLLFLSPSSHLPPSLSSAGAGFHQEAWAAGERGYSGEKSRGLQPALQKVRYKYHALHCTRVLNFSGHSLLGQISLIGALVLTAAWWFVLGYCLTLRVKWQVPKLSKCW